MEEEDDDDEGERPPVLGLRLFMEGLARLGLTGVRERLLHALRPEERLRLPAIL